MPGKSPSDPRSHRLVPDAGQTGGAAGAHRRLTEAIGWLPAILWVPAAMALLTLAVGGLGLAAGQPWLIASLGPTAYLQTLAPAQPAARFQNAVVGHLVAVVAGMGAVLLLGAEATPSVFTSHEISGLRLGASALALAVAAVVEVGIGMSHPPAAATVLLITLGGFEPTPASGATILAGVLLMAGLGEPLRRWRCPPDRRQGSMRIPMRIPIS
jgi:hypothetical protein